MLEICAVIDRLTKYRHRRTKYNLEDIELCRAYGCITPEDNCSIFRSTHETNYHVVCRISSAIARKSSRTGALGVFLTAMSASRMVISRGPGGNSFVTRTSGGGGFGC